MNHPHDLPRVPTEPLVLEANARVPLAVEYVRACSKTLWARCTSSSHSRKDARHRMLEGLEWLSSKHGWEAERNVRQAYQQRGLRVEGRLNLELRTKSLVLALELCYEVQESTMLKLWAAHLQHKKTLLLWAGPPMPDSRLGERLAEPLNERTVPWLRFSQLRRQE